VERKEEAASVAAKGVHAGGFCRWA